MLRRGVLDNPTATANNVAAEKIFANQGLSRDKHTPASPHVAGADGRQAMLVCFTSDLHGDAQLYGQLEALLRAHTPDLLVLGGDLLRDIDPRAPTLLQTAALESEFVQRIATWRAMVPHLAVACIAGNHELACTRDALQSHHDADRLVFLDQRAGWPSGGFTWCGYSCAPPSPHWAKDFERLDQPGDQAMLVDAFAWDRGTRNLQPVDVAQYFASQPTIAAELNRHPHAADPWILVAHAPPYGSDLDRLPHVPHPIGSRAIRDFITAHRPHISLHGHVHESPEVTGHFAQRIGQTLAINPGQSHGRLYAVLFDPQRPEETLRHTVFGPFSKS